MKPLLSNPASGAARAVLCLTSILAHTVAVAQGTNVCPLTVYPSPTGLPVATPTTLAQANAAGDPCVDGETVFTQSFYRTDGKPQAEIENFSLDEAADVCVIGVPDAKGKAFLYVDGTKIAEPEEFDHGSIAKVQSLSAGQHGLGVTPVGKPGGIVQIEVRQLPSGGGGDPGVPGPGEVRINSETGALDMVNADNSVRLQNVASDHPLLTPNNDGDDDTTEFQALTTPLVPLPGKEEGTVAYFLDWEFQVVDLFTCNTIDTGLAGRQQINSPTLVATEFSGLDASGAQLPDGNYAYVFAVTVVDQFDTEFGSITSPGFGFIIDSDILVDYDEGPEYLGACNPSTDPDGCLCPAGDPNCKFSWVTDLLPELGLPPGTPPNYMNPELVDRSFISTSFDASTGRYTVTVDLRNYNAGGLVPKARGVWASEADLRQWVSDMTGVPVGTGDSLFNFDYVQLGTSTGVNTTGITNFSFNHFFLDAITDTSGIIRIGGFARFLAAEYNDDVGAPPLFQLTAPRIGDECRTNANTDGVSTVRGKFCAYNNAFRVSPTRDLGFYALRTTLFDIDLGGEDRTTRDEHCVIDGGNVTCGVRTFQEPIDLLEIEARYYEDNGSDPLFVRALEASAADATGLSISADREGNPGTTIDGVCADAVAEDGGVTVLMKSADGAVPETCVINGIF